MNSVIKEMLAQYQIQSTKDAENALKEIIQEVALLGLHRANFFEKAAFYGGTALRILYGLPRFSEDLDFTLFKTKRDFSLQPYFSSIQKELEAYGFETSVVNINKKKKSDFESAFIKANTKIHYLKIESLKSFETETQGNAKLKIKFEVDIDPATPFEYEARYLLAPTSFPVISLKKPDLFAGKLHALLYRQWKDRIKGRDFYDFVWYVKNKTPIRLSYFRQKALQSGHIQESEVQTLNHLKDLILDKINGIDFENAKRDVLPFIKDPQEIEVWSKDFFAQVTEKIEIE